MTRLIIVNGPPGVGKSTVCRQLYQRLDGAVWLDGDWCWLMHPWDYSAQNKAMVLENITFLLRNYLKSGSFRYIILSWVIPDEAIFRQILDRLGEADYYLFRLTLICSEAALRARMQQDGREESVIERSVALLPRYRAMSTRQIDTTSPNETVERILAVLNE